MPTAYALLLPVHDFPNLESPPSNNPKTYLSDYRNEMGKQSNRERSNKTETIPSRARYASQIPAAILSIPMTASPGWVQSRSAAPPLADSIPTYYIYIIFLVNKYTKFKAKVLIFISIQNSKYEF